MLSRSSGSEVNQASCIIQETTYAGDTVAHSVRLENGAIVRVVEPAHASAAGPNEALTLSFPPDAVMVFRH